MVGVLEYIVGWWGVIFISIGLIILVMGVYLLWILLVVEVFYCVVKSYIMLSVLVIENKYGVFFVVVWMFNIFI